jgi:hypothetical protein
MFLVDYNANVQQKNLPHNILHGRFKIKSSLRCHADKEFTRKTTPQRYGYLKYQRM